MTIPGGTIVENTNGNYYPSFGGTYTVSTDISEPCTWRATGAAAYLYADAPHTATDYLYFSGSGLECGGSRDGMWTFILSQNEVGNGGFGAASYSMPNTTGDPRGTYTLDTGSGIGVWPPTLTVS